MKMNLKIKTKLDLDQFGQDSSSIYDDNDFVEEKKMEMKNSFKPNKYLFEREMELEIKLEAVAQLKCTFLRMEEQSYVENIHQGQ